MQYRVKEVVENGKSYFYPQYKKRWFWRRFVWWGGEDGTSPRTVFFTNMAGALREIEEHKEYLKKKAQAEPDKTVYHYLDDQEIFNPNNQPLTSSQLLADTSPFKLQARRIQISK